MSVSSHFPEANRLYLSLQRKVEDLESKIFNQSLYNEVSTSITLRRGRREMWIGRIEGLADSHMTIEKALTRLETSHQRRVRNSQMRDKLFGSPEERAAMVHLHFLKSIIVEELGGAGTRRSTTHIKPISRISLNVQSRTPPKREEYASCPRQTQGLSLSESLHRSNEEADRILETGRATLENLRNQGSILKSAHRKVLDVANTLGLSNSLIKMIERRENMDKILVFAGMSVSLLVLFILYYYFVRK
eukprot:jgi/Bigna1/85643/estExt_fgenesh1_pg.C_50114